MIEHDASPPDDSDAELAQFFTLLKQVEPPLAARVDFRVTIAQEITREIARMQATAHRQASPWWKRSISVPAPVALALSLLLTASVAISQLPWKNGSGDAVVVTDRLDSPNPAVRRSNDSIPEETHDQPLVVYVSGTYLCGVGPLSTESRYLIQESNK